MPVLKIKKSDGSWQEVWGCISTSSDGGSTPKLTSITMFAENWSGDNGIYSQVVSCNGVDVNSKLDLQPTPNQVVELQDSEISMMATNTNGVVTIYALGYKPQNNMTMDVLITEVTIV